MWNKRQKQASQQQNSMMEVLLPPMSVVLPGSTILEIARVRKTRLNEACAVAIQSVARGKLAKREAERRRAAVILLQGVIRLRLAVKERYARQRFLIAVLTIQCWARQLRAMYLNGLAKEEVRRQCAAITIQCWARGTRAMTVAREARKAQRVQRAAITILYLAQQHKAKLDMQKAKEERAATTILCLARQRRARLEVKKAKEERDRRLAEKREMDYLGARATTIQTVVRQRLARKRRDGMEKAWVVFRVLARKCLARSFRRNATTIQSIARMYLVKQSMGPIRAKHCAQERSCIVLQGFGRIVLAKIAYNRVTVAKALTEMEELHARMLQTTLARPMLAKKKVQERQRGKVEAKSARTIQSVARMVFSKRVAKTLKQERTLTFLILKSFKRSFAPCRGALISARDAGKGVSNRAGSILFQNSSAAPAVSVHVKTKDARGKAVHSIYSFPGMGRLLSFVVVNLVVFTIISKGMHMRVAQGGSQATKTAIELTPIEEFAFEHLSSSVDMAY